MRSKIFLSVLAFGLMVCAFGQKPSMTLTFKAENNGQHVPLNSILIENLTQGGDTTLYAPDFVLEIDYVFGIGDDETIGSNAFTVSQNYPNPIVGKTTVSLYLPDYKDVSITISDIMGRELIHREYSLDRGGHFFTFFPGKESLYLLTVQTDHQSQTVKMVNSPSNSFSSGIFKLEYNGQKHTGVGEYKSGSALNNFVFDPGDQLKYTASSTLGDRTIIDSPSDNQTYTFQYGSGGLSCPGTPTITDIDGNVYNTVLIGTQCWMKENLKTTTYNNSISIPNITNADEWEVLTSGAYAWYENNIEWKDYYGALYNWYAIVGANELCPSGWHVPDHNEWTTLTTFIGGTNAPHGNELKSCRQVNSPLGGECNTSIHPRWKSNSSNWGTDDYGFSGLPGSERFTYGSFDIIGDNGNWWSSTEYSSNYGWSRKLDRFSNYVLEGDNPKRSGLSIRCLRHESTSNTPEVETGSVLNITPTSANCEGEIIYLGSSDIVQHGHCWSMEQNPTINDFLSDLGSTSSTGSFLSNLAGLESTTTYYIRAYAINSSGISYGEVVEFETFGSGTGAPCPGMPTITDIDGNEYNTVLIGEQCWMKENLKTTTYRNGTSIPNVTDSWTWSELTSGAYVWYENDISWKGPYGALYNWYATVDANGLCPSGWHVPTKDEWTILIDFIGGTNPPHGNELKSCRQVDSPLGGGCNTTEHPRWNHDFHEWGTDDYGFSGLPGSSRHFGGPFYTIGYDCFWWTSTEYSSTEAWRLFLFHDSGYVNDGTTDFKQDGEAVRCLRD